MKATHATAFGRTIGSLETAETIEAPQDWRTIPTAYILPSEAYKGALEGHPRSVDIIERLGGHLDIVNDGEAIALILLDLARPSQWLTPTCHPSIADMPFSAHLEAPCDAVRSRCSGAGGFDRSYFVFRSS